MIELTPIMDRIASETGYTVERARETQPNLMALDTLPMVFVGYMEITPYGEVNTDFTGDAYANHADDMMQKFSVQVVCEEDTLHTVWENVKDSLVGWNPDATQAIYSTMGYGGGGMLGLTNGRIWWVDNWLLSFPKIS